MLRCSNDTHSMMDLSLTHIGLLIATAILLSVVFLFVFSNDWQRNAELQAQASSFSNLLTDIDNSFFEQTSIFRFSHEDFPYSVRISTEYIVLSAKGSWQNTQSVAHRFLIRPWLRSTQLNWTTGGDLHTYLNETYGHMGTQEDPITQQNFSFFFQQLNNTTAFFASQPLELLINEPVYMEKAIVFYDENKRYDILLLYQLMEEVPN
jgi:hypothetical protein